jgi:hypothetical protein
MTSDAAALQRRGQLRQQLGVGVHGFIHRRQFALQHARVVAPAFQPFLRHVAGVDVFHAVAQCLHDGVGQRDRA